MAAVLVRQPYKVQVVQIDFRLNGAVGRKGIGRFRRRLDQSRFGDALVPRVQKDGRIGVRAVAAMRLSGLRFGRRKQLLSRGRFRFVNLKRLNVFVFAVLFRTHIGRVFGHLVSFPATVGGERLMRFVCPAAGSAPERDSALSTMHLQQGG